MSNLTEKLLKEQELDLLLFELKNSELKRDWIELMNLENLVSN